MELSSGVWLTIIKSASIIVLFLVTIAFGFTPLKSPQFRSNDNLVSYFRSFSAGLFLGMGLLHLLNESEQDYYDYLQISYDSQKPYPFPLLIALASFSIILLIEKVVFNSHELMHQMEDDDAHVNVDDSQRELLNHDMNFLGPIVLRKNPSLPCDFNKESENFKKLIGWKEQVARRLINNERQRNLQVTSCIGCQEEQKDVLSRRGKSAKTLIYPLLPQRVERKSVEKEYIHTHQNVKSIGPYIILFALSIHGVFEGIAVGIQKSPPEAINLVSAVLLHKWAEALTLGVAFVKGKLQQKVIIVQILMFAAAGPLGIGIGWGISGCPSLISGIFKAISAGTFLYISTSELIVEEFNISRRVLAKFLLYLLGLIIMALILLAD